MQTEIQSVIVQGTGLAMGVVESVTKPDYYFLQLWGQRACNSVIQNDASGCVMRNHGHHTPYFPAETVLPSQPSIENVQ